MNKFVLLIMLTGCTSVPIKPNFPQVPPELLEPAPMLTPLQENEKELSDLLNNVNENYGTYYIIKEKLTAWQTWYNQQQRIFNQ